MTLSEIKRIRKALRLTQDELAARLGVSKRSVSRWETGAVKPCTLAVRALLEIAQETIVEGGKK